MNVHRLLAKFCNSSCYRDTAAMRIRCLAFKKCTSYSTVTLLGLFVRSLLRRLNVITLRKSTCRLFCMKFAQQVLYGLKIVVVQFGVCQLTQLDSEYFLNWNIYRRNHWFTPSTRTVYRIFIHLRFFWLFAKVTFHFLNLTRWYHQLCTFGGSVSVE